MEKLTLWQVFFMLLTVIPFSKFILAVLVKMVVPNKPEGNRWGTSFMGVGMIISTIGRIKPLGGRSSGGGPQTGGSRSGGGSQTGGSRSGGGSQGGGSRSSGGSRPREAPAKGNYPRK